MIALYYCSDTIVVALKSLKHFRNKASQNKTKNILHEKRLENVNSETKRAQKIPPDTAKSNRINPAPVS